MRYMVAKNARKTVETYIIAAHFINYEAKILAKQSSVHKVFQKFI
jgi:hypothetical protein